MAAFACGPQEWKPDTGEVAPSPKRRHHMVGEVPKRRHLRDGFTANNGLMEQDEVFPTPDREPGPLSSWANSNASPVATARVPVPCGSRSLASRPTDVRSVGLS